MSSYSEGPFLIIFQIEHSTQLWQSLSIFIFLHGSYHYLTHIFWLFCFWPVLESKRQVSRALFVCCCIVSAQKSAWHLAGNTLLPNECVNVCKGGCVVSVCVCVCVCVCYVEPYVVVFDHFFFFLIFIYLWLCWVFVSVRGLSPVAASGGHSSSRCAGLSLSRPLLLRSAGSRRAGSVAVAHGSSCSAACGIFPDQGSNPCPLHWQADSQPLRHQGSPLTTFDICHY